MLMTFPEMGNCKARAVWRGALARCRIEGVADFAVSPDNCDNAILRSPRLGDRACAAQALT